MPTSEITYSGELRTKAIHLQSGTAIITDAPVDNYGKGEAFSPTDLLSTSLGCCMLTIMGIVARNHQLNIDGTKAVVTKIMDANPRRVTEIVIDFTFPSGNFTGKEKALLEHAALNCPVAKSIHPDIKQKISFNY